jgi:acyl carrier protein
VLNQPFNDSDVLDIIQEEIDLILVEKGHPPKRISADDRLGPDLALESLDLARVVGAVEIRTGADPFQHGASFTRVRTIGDLQNAYRMYFAGTAAAKESEALLAAKRRIAARMGGQGGGE